VILSDEDEHEAERFTRGILAKALVADYSALQSASSQNYQKKILFNILREWIWLFHRQLQPVKDSKDAEVTSKLHGHVYERAAVLSVL